MYLFLYFIVSICHSNIILCLRPQFVGLYQVKSKISVAQSSCLKYYTPYTLYTPHTILIPLLLCALAWIYKLQNCLTMRLLMLELSHFYMATHTLTHTCICSRNVKALQSSTALSPLPPPPRFVAVIVPFMPACFLRAFALVVAVAVAVAWHRCHSL